MHRLTILLPARNEAATIGPLVRDLYVCMPGCDVLVANNSSDDTGLIAAEAGARVVNLPARGKGFAVRGALRHVNTPFMAMIDADYTYPPQAVYQAYVKHRMNMGRRNFVVGIRKTREKGSMTALNAFGNKALSLWASMLFGVKMSDVCTGLWVGEAASFRRLHLNSDGFTLEAELFAKAVKNHYSIIQIPIDYYSRPEDSHSKLKVVDGLKIGKRLLTERFK